MSSWRDIDHRARRRVQVQRQREAGGAGGAGVRHNRRGLAAHVGVTRTARRCRIKVVEHERIDRVDAVVGAPRTATRIRSIETHATEAARDASARLAPVALSTARQRRLAIRSQHFTSLPGQRSAQSARRPQAELADYVGGIRDAKHGRSGDDYVVNDGGRESIVWGPLSCVQFIQICWF